MAEGEASGTQLTPVGKILSVLVILGLVGVGVFVVSRKAQPPQPPGPADPSSGAPQAPKGPEAPDNTSVTTVKEYAYKAEEKLPPVKGTSGYEWDAQKKVFKFSYNVWAGWLPVIAANMGTKPSDESVFFKKHGFRVEMVLMDDPIAARDAFAAGKVHSLWGTLDMLVLFAPELVKDSRTAPRIVQQIDWSNGGDGIVVRSGIKNVGDLKGKTIALAQNSPSEYYLNTLLISAGVKPSAVKTKFTATAFEAAAAFVADKSVDACVSWAPDIYKIPEKVAGTRILSTTADANKLIADVYGVRADFVKDHPDVVEGLVAGIFEGMDMVKKAPEDPAKWMAEAFGMKPEDIMGMRNDAHLTNFAENQQFFLNSSNPTNLERTWKSASFVYRELMRIQAPVPFDNVMDFSFLKRIEAKGTFKHHTDENVAKFTPGSFQKVSAEAPILTQTIRINFYPNSSNPFEAARDDVGNVIQGRLFDPNVATTLERVAQLSGQFARAVILVEGHTDSSMKGKVNMQAVKDLSMSRAEAIKRALIDKYKFDANKFSIVGKGWDEPADSGDPMNQALNRRVEINVYPPEQDK